jgi:hypothetical protein
MRVTKVDPLLGRLVAFLNFDFKTGTQESLKRARLNVHELMQAGWNKRGAKLQEEIRSDLIPLLTGTPTDDMNEREERLKLQRQWKVKKTDDKKQHEMMLKLMAAGPRHYHGPRFYLDRLLEKINRLELQFWWYAQPGQHELTIYDLDLTRPLSKKTGYPEPIAGTERKETNPARGLLAPERRITTVVGEKFIVAKQPSAHAKSSRELLYGIIADSLENGGFNRLRMCRECSKFFLGLDLKRKFCRDRCKDQFFNSKKAKEGKFKEYRQQRAKRNRAQLKKARRLFFEGKSVASVIEDTGLSRRILEREGLLD